MGRRWGLSPEEFWHGWTLVEFLTVAIHERYHANDPGLAGGMSRADLDELTSLLDE